MYKLSVSSCCSLWFVWNMLHHMKPSDRLILTLPSPGVLLCLTSSTSLLVSERTLSPFMKRHFICTRSASQSIDISQGLVIFCLFYIIVFFLSTKSATNRALYMGSQLFCMSWIHLAVWWSLCTVNALNKYVGLRSKILKKSY